MSDAPMPEDNYGAAPRDINLLLMLYEAVKARKQYEETIERLAEAGIISPQYGR